MDRACDAPVMARLVLRPERAQRGLAPPWVFSNEMGTTWLTHNVEEVSMFEHVLPPLYTAL